MVHRLQEQVADVEMEMNKAGLGVEVHTRPRGTHDWRETPASEVLDARALKAAAQAGHSSQTPSFLGKLRCLHYLQIAAIKQTLAGVCGCMSCDPPWTS